MHSRLVCLGPLYMQSRVEGIERELAITSVFTLIEGLLRCRYEVDKLTASQRLDLNLEKGRMRDELQVTPTYIIPPSVP